MRSHEIYGPSGVRLHAMETGRPEGLTFLFVHGISQCSLAWMRQLHSDLAQSFRLVAVDLRGHGLSERPEVGYEDSKLWADDLRAVIEALGLESIVLCGWSYGPLVLLDYLRHYGEDGIRGLNFVGGVTKLGSAEATSVLTPEFVALAPGLFSTDVTESVRALDALVELCHNRELTAEDRSRMLGYNVSVPPFVRQSMLSRTLDNDDLVARLRIPVLVTHGADDRVVSPSVIERQMSGFSHLEVRLIPGAGHACFWDDPLSYNRCLRELAATL